MYLTLSARTSRCFYSRYWNNKIQNKFGRNISGILFKYNVMYIHNYSLISANKNTVRHLLDQTQERYYFTYILPIIDPMKVELLQQHGFNFIVLARPRSKNRIVRQNVMIKQFKLVEVRQNLIISSSVPPASLRTVISHRYAKRRQCDWRWE